MTAPVKEADFQAAVIELAELQGWRVFHPHDSRKSQPGFPDLTMVRDGRLIFAELKTNTGKITADQAIWLSDLSYVAKIAQGNISTRHPVMAVKVWQPSDWPEIEQALKR